MSRQDKIKVPVSIDERIGAMRRMVQRFFLVAGLSRFLVWLLCIVALDYFLDSNFQNGLVPAIDHVIACCIYPCLHPLEIFGSAIVLEAER